MKTKAECLQRAVICERMSADTDDEANRLALVATAAHWRALANHARAAEGTARSRMQAEASATERISGPGAAHENRKHTWKSRRRSERPDEGKSAVRSKV